MSEFWTLGIFLFLVVSGRSVIILYKLERMIGDVLEPIDLQGEMNKMELW